MWVNESIKLYMLHPCSQRFIIFTTKLLNLRWLCIWKLKLKKKNGKSEWGGCKSLIGHSSKPNEEKKEKKN